MPNYGDSRSILRRRSIGSLPPPLPGIRRVLQLLLRPVDKPNCLCCQSQQGGFHFTVVGSCRPLGIDPLAYLRDVLPKLHELGADPKDEQLADLLPDAWARRRQAAVAATTAVA